MKLTKITCIVLFQTTLQTFSLASSEKREVYGYDISFPMLEDVSTNYPWLPHNIDRSIPTPDKYKNMSIQPQGDRLTFYQDFIQGCRDYWRQSHGNEICNETELKR